MTKQNLFISVQSPIPDELSAAGGSYAERQVMAIPLFRDNILVGSLAISEKGSLLAKKRTVEVMGIMGTKGPLCFVSDIPMAAKRHYNKDQKRYEFHLPLKDKQKVIGAFVFVSDVVEQQKRLEGFLLSRGSFLPVGCWSSPIIQKAFENFSCGISLGAPYGTVWLKHKRIQAYVPSSVEKKQALSTAGLTKNKERAVVATKWMNKERES